MRMGNSEEIDATALWLDRVTEVYENLETRMNLECWQELLAAESFSRIELISFMMGHYRFSTDVWRFLNERLNLTGDVGNLNAQFPAAFVNYMVNRCVRGEKIDFTQFEGEADALYDVFLSYYDCCAEALREDRLEQAAEYIKKADDIRIFHPQMEICRAFLLEKQGNIQAGIEGMTALWSRFPKDISIGYETAEMLWRNGRKQEGATVYEALKALDARYYMANVRLAEWYLEQGRYEDAKSCVQQIESTVVVNKFKRLLADKNIATEKKLEEQYSNNRDWSIGLELCSCYLQSGKFVKGMQLAAGIEKVIPEQKQAEFNEVLTGLYVEGAEYEEALCLADAWEESLKGTLPRKPHLVRIQCYENLSYLDSDMLWYAIEEIQAMETGTSEDIGLLLEKARIYRELGEYEESFRILQELLEDYQVYEAYVELQEVYNGLGDMEGMIQAGKRSVFYLPWEPRGYELLAKAYFSKESIPELRALLLQAESNRIESVWLDAYRYQLEHEVPRVEVLRKKLPEFHKRYLDKVKKGKLAYYEKGLPVITEYLHSYPGSHMLLERGLFHMAAGHMAEAKKDLERALSDYQGNYRVLYGLYEVYRAEGDYEKAMHYLKRALLYGGKIMGPAAFAQKGDLYVLMGQENMAQTAYRDVIDLFQETYRNTPEGYETLVTICQWFGEKEKARDYFEKWHKAMGATDRYVSNSQYERYYHRLAWQELLFGTVQNAFKYLEEQIRCIGAANNINEAYCPMIFVAILCGEEDKGKLYAAKLREWRDKQEREKNNAYYRREKERWYMEFLADYYVKSSKELETLLEQAEKCPSCHTCAVSNCKRLEAVRILLMMRKGRTDRALVRINENLEKCPFNEHLLAMRNICRDGVKVIADPEEKKTTPFGKFAGLFGKKRP